VTIQLPRSVFLGGDTGTRTGLSLDEVNQILVAKDGHLWVDIDIDSAPQAEFLKGIKGQHPLAVEDALSRQSRPKLEEFPDYLFMVILGGSERDKFVAQRQCFSPKVCSYYDEAATYHDGKWIMFPLDAALFDDYKRILEIKRKSNKNTIV
jgi:Mg2+ and Co2+ transporter CorA